MRVHEDRQIHQAVSVRQQQPLARHLTEFTGRFSPLRVVQHDVARTLRVAKSFECDGKILADGAQAVGGRVAIPQDQAVVLVGLEQLLAAPFAAHHKQAAIGHQIGRCQQLPGALNQAGIELLHQPGNQVDA